MNYIKQRNHASWSQTKKIQSKFFEFTKVQWSMIRKTLSLSREGDTHAIMLWPMCYFEFTLYPNISNRSHLNSKSYKVPLISNFNIGWSIFVISIISLLIPHFPSLCSLLATVAITQNLRLLWSSIMKAWEAYLVHSGCHTPNFTLNCGHVWSISMYKYQLNMRNITQHHWCRAGYPMFVWE